MLNHINKIGVELEGGWKNTFPEDDPTEIYADHSVHLGGFTHIGEIASPPLLLEEAIKWTDVHYPDGSDTTCGMHIHVSVKDDLAYARLSVSPHFYMKFLLWGKAFCDTLPKGDDRDRFYSRLKGDNRFCALKFIPSRQIPLKRKGGGNNVDANPRYTQLNFAKGVHGTVENRTFPIFKEKETALKVIEAYVGLVEEFLASPGGEGNRKLRVVR